MIIDWIQDRIRKQVSRTTSNFSYMAKSWLWLTVSFNDMEEPWGKSVSSRVERWR